jgi:hypothetical protein
MQLVAFCVSILLVFWDIQSNRVGGDAVIAACWQGSLPVGVPRQLDTFPGK